MHFLHKPRDKGDIVAIFVHAGAGYHSKQNENLHLAAVNDAAKTAMTILKNGGDATDAVEFAIRVLEDREITNAGFGSNLTAHGVVECDATMVDHLGRSGAVGAVPQVKNPIALARIVLQESTKPLSLQRVPPNLLVGDGATDFAEEYSVPIIPNEYLVSEGAKDRWRRWKKDLERVKQYEEDEAARRKPATQQLETKDTPTGSIRSLSPPPTPADPRNSPIPALPSPIEPITSPVSLPTTAQLDPEIRPSLQGASVPGTDSINAYDSHYHHDGDYEAAIDDNLEWLSSPPKRTKIQGSFDGSGDHYKTTEALQLSDVDDDDREDNITDTVGAIAIDVFGRIAAGSSSGGIGMKHKGRCGPAALVGIGTAVLPADPKDPDQMCCASVTSGTGEHMATTLAASTACDRIYNSVKKENGRLITCTEEEAMKSVIDKEFMSHPGVANSHCAGAIGIMSVKKSKDGVWFYFGHNTDSFALASMTGEERKPICTMSRNRGNATIAGGGRSIKSKHAKKG